MRNSKIVNYMYDMNDPVPFNDHGIFSVCGSVICVYWVEISVCGCQVLKVFVSFSSL